MKFTLATRKKGAHHVRAHGCWAIVTIAAAVASIVIETAFISPAPAHAPAHAHARQDVCSLSPAPMISGHVIENKPPCFLPDLTFSDESGTALSLDDFRGKTVLVTLWASWCPPCVREMPSLDRLQAMLGGDHFAVIPISQDRGGSRQARQWFTEHGIKHLVPYGDPTAASARALNAPGLPVSMIVDPQGREQGRLYGKTEWDSLDMTARLRQWIANGTLQEPETGSSIPDD